MIKSATVADLAIWRRGDTRRCQGRRRSYCSTVAIPAFVTCIVTSLVLPSVAATNAPELDDICAGGTAMKEAAN
jgi:hypothetical protein